jgi:hypothetical protein
MTPLFRGSIIFPLVAASARGRDIRPTIVATLTDRDNMIASQLTWPENMTAIQAQVAIPGKQGTICQRRFVVTLPSVLSNPRVGQ